MQLFSNKAKARLRSCIHIFFNKTTTKTLSVIREVYTEYTYNNNFKMGLVISGPE